MPLNLKKLELKLLHIHPPQATKASRTYLLTLMMIPPSQQKKRLKGIHMVLHAVPDTIGGDSSDTSKYNRQNDRNEIDFNGRCFPCAAPGYSI